MFSPCISFFFVVAGITTKKFLLKKQDLKMADTTIVVDLARFARLCEPARAAALLAEKVLAAFPSQDLERKVDGVLSILRSLRASALAKLCTELDDVDACIELVNGLLRGRAPAATAAGTVMTSLLTQVQFACVALLLGPGGGGRGPPFE